MSIITSIIITVASSIYHEREGGRACVTMKIFPTLIQWTLYAVVSQLQSWTKVVETLPKKPVLLNAWLFQPPIFTFRPPLPFSMLQSRDSVHGANFNIEKRGERGVWLLTKKMFFKLGKNADRKRLFCSNVSTLLYMKLSFSQNKYQLYYICVENTLNTATETV